MNSSSSWLQTPWIFLILWTVCCSLTTDILNCQSEQATPVTLPMQEGTLDLINTALTQELLIIIDRAFLRTFPVIGTAPWIQATIQQLPALDIWVPSTTGGAIL